ncbi:MAG: hypothetical protein HUU38_25445 [Anaerolineales bacterium]|nr:hypothetical protein [Anaerolineales bacterium]
MLTNLPKGSKITIKQDGPNPIISIPYASPNPLKYLIGLFILFWLGGWAVGFKSAFEQVISGEADVFLVFWLGGWSIGGFFAGFSLFRIFQPPISATLTLNPRSLSYDSGIPPLELQYMNRYRRDAWKNYFPRRKKVEITLSDLRTMRLRSTDTSNRLTIDVGVERLDIASGAGEIEREWLYKTIHNYYRLADRQN